MYIRTARAGLFFVAGLASGADYQVNGRLAPAARTAVVLNGVTAPFERSTLSDSGGHFRFDRLPAGTYTLTAVAGVRGEVRETVEIGPGTADAKRRVDVKLVLGEDRVEADRRSGRGVVAARDLAVPAAAIKEQAAARQALATHDTAGAVTHLRRAVEIAPGLSAAWNQLGTIAYQTGEYAEAEQDFRRALEADAEAFEPLVNLGGVLLNLERPQEALRYNQSAVERRPNDALANSQLGMSWFYSGNPGQAERYLAAAKRLDPAHFSQPQLLLAEIYLRRNERAAAIGELEDLLRRHPDAARATQIRATIAQLSERAP